MRKPHSTARPSPCTHLARSSFMHRAVCLKLRDEFEAVSESRLHTQGEIIMHSSRTTRPRHNEHVRMCWCAPLHTSVTALHAIAAVVVDARGSCSTPWFYIIVLILLFSPSLSVSATWLWFLDHLSSLFVSYFLPFIVHFLSSIATTTPASPERSTGPSPADKVFSCRNPQASR